MLPTLWFRNTWSWGCTQEGCAVRPQIHRTGDRSAAADEPVLGRFLWTLEAAPDSPHEFLFTENETNIERLFGIPNTSAWVKDAFHRHVVDGQAGAVNPAERGTKAAFHVAMEIEAGGERTIELRLANEQAALIPLDLRARAAVFAARQAENEQYHAATFAPGLTEAERMVARQAYAGLLWSKQFYHYVVDAWLDGDPEQPRPPAERKLGRNSDWRHLYNRDVISMPDKWEYPWYAAWDLAFHMLPMARIDPDFAKGQLSLFLREWYMHPNGQIPAYEWALSDVNPPVHAWAVWRVYKKSAHGEPRDRVFLASAFQKLLLNFTWWVNRKDASGKHVFSGGFLGLDNIGVFDRSRPLPTGGTLDQADGTAWMAFYCGTMLSIALELALEDRVYEDMASKFFEHFIAIVDAMNHLGGSGLWDEEDGFYYDKVTLEGRVIPLRTRSMVGLLPLIAVEVLEQETIDRLPGFKKRMEWFLENRRDLSQHVSVMESKHGHTRRLLAIPARARLERVLRYLFDESEFLSPHGVRSLSRVHAGKPFTMNVGGTEHRVDYAPGEADTSLFGGNSNWRGPVWFPVNFLLIEALERYHHFYGDEFEVELPTGSGRYVNLRAAAAELARRLVGIFLPGADGARPCFGADRRYAEDPNWNELVLFHEYFHGDNGSGLGASHQTGWTALVVPLLESLAHERTKALGQRAEPVALGATQLRSVAGRPT